MAVITGDQDPNNKNDVLHGGTEDDTISGLTGNDSLHGDAGNDTLIGDVGQDVLRGGIGHDTLFGGAEFDDLEGNEGDDILSGDAGNDQLRGGAGDDILLGGDGNDFLEAFGGGKDQLRGGAGKDILKVAINYQNIADSTIGERWDGGSGDDTVQLFLGVLGKTKKTTVDLTKVTIVGVEHLTVADTPFPNRDYTYTFKIKTAQFNAFDSIVMPSQLGHIFQITDHGATVKLPKWMDFGPVINLTSSADKLDGTTMKNGSVLVNAGKGNDKIIGNSSVDGFFEVFLGDGSDVFTGRASRQNTAHGGDGDDTLTGNRRIDIFDGGDDDDKLSGGAGDDQLNGGRGKDRLTGGEDQDIFIFTSVKDSAANNNRDIITDFHTRSDKKVEAIDYDKIDLHLIDADSRTKGTNDKFDFIGKSEFSGTHGELRFEHGILEGDVNGDRKADFEIRLSNVTGLAELDLIL